MSVSLDFCDFGTFVPSILHFLVRFFDSLVPAASILIDFQRFMSILDLSHPRFVIVLLSLKSGHRFLSKCIPSTAPVHKKWPPGICPGIPRIPRIPGNGPNWAGLALGSTRAGGKDDGCLHNLPQVTFRSDEVYSACRNNPGGV